MKLTLHLSNGTNAHCDTDHCIDLTYPIIDEKFHEKGASNRIPEFGDIDGHPTSFADNLLEIPKHSVQCQRWHLIPHLTGTHTECVGHISEAQVWMTDILTENVPQLTVGLVLTMQAVPLNDSILYLPPSANERDWIVTEKVIEESLTLLHLPLDFPLENVQSIIAHSSPFDEHVYWTVEAIEWLIITFPNIIHLVIDKGSLDRLDDAGRLAAHRAWFGLKQKGQMDPVELALLKLFHNRDTNKSDNIPSFLPKRFLTELCRIPNALKSGLYAVQVTPLRMESDASPSVVTAIPITLL